jgi:hypothetical protein
MEKLSKSEGFTKLPTCILEQLIADKTLNKREIAAILLVIRLTLGTRQRFCELRKIDFLMANIRPNHIAEILENCKAKHWIYFYDSPDTCKTNYSICAERFREDKHKEIQDPKLHHIIGHQLRKIHLKKHLATGYGHHRISGTL